MRAVLVDRLADDLALVFREPERLAGHPTRAPGAEFRRGGARGRAVAAAVPSAVVTGEPRPIGVEGEVIGGGGLGANGCGHDELSTRATEVARGAERAFLGRLRATSEYARSLPRYGPSSARFGREWRPPRATSEHARSLPRYGPSSARFGREWRPQRATSTHARSLPRVRSVIRALRAGVAPPTSDERIRPIASAIRSVIRPLRTGVAPPASDERTRPIAPATTVRHPPASDGSGAPNERRANAPDRSRDYGPSSARFEREWRPQRATSTHARSLPRRRSVIPPLRTGVAPPASDERPRPLRPAPPQSPRRRSPPPPAPRAVDPPPPSLVPPSDPPCARRRLSPRSSSSRRSPPARPRARPGSAPRPPRR